MHVIFVEPGFPTNQREFVRGLAAAGAHVTGIGEAPLDALDGELKGWLGAYEQVPTVVHEETLYRTVRMIQERGWVDRLEATVEAHVMPTAHARERATIPGTSTRTAYLCRDKPAMKEVLRAAGIPCAQSTGTDSLEELEAFAKEVGYPLILKPRAAAGASGTYRVDDIDALRRVAAEVGVGRGGSVAAEEYMEGHEGFYDTLTMNGEVIHDFACHYFPGVLEAMRTRWISPQIITTNRIDTAPDYGEVKEMGRKVIEVLGIETSATHMEWFFGPKGLKFSEIGCRPPGVGVWDLYAAANEMDIYREWAMLVTGRGPSQRASRNYSAGMIALRPDHDGYLAGYEGLEEALGAYREHLIDFHAPPPGTPTQPVEAGYMANAWVRLRHPDYDQLRNMLDSIGKHVQVRAG